MDMPAAVRYAVIIINRTLYPSGYSLYFLLFGIMPLKYNNILINAPELFYLYDYTLNKEKVNNTELARFYKVPLA